MDYGRNPRTVGVGKETSITDLIILCVLALVGFWGWRRGTLLMALSLGGLVAGYVGAFLFYRPVGLILMDLTGLAPVAAYPLAGMLLWLVIGAVLNIVQQRAGKARKAKRSEGWAPTRTDSVGGAVIGVLLAIGMVAMVLWVMMGVRLLAERGPDVSSTLSARATSVAVEKVVYVAARRLTRERVLASVMSVVAANPAEGSETIRTVIHDERFVRLLADEDLRSRLIDGDVEGLARTEALRGLAGDQAFLDAAARLEMVGPDATTGRASAEELVEALAPIARTIQALLDDPEIREQLNNPELRERIQGGDIRALATDPDFNRLAAKVLKVLRSSGGAGRE